MTIETKGNKTIHYCNYASQPYVQIACTGLNEYAWNIVADSVYQTDDGSMYTFTEEKVTCEACKAYIKQSIEKASQR